jgi:anti-sigma-K factor RskA
MDYSRPELADRLAAEYVLGTLRGPARRRFEALLPAHPALNRAMLDWQRRVDALSVSVPAVPPSPRVWQGVQQRLFQHTVQPVVRWWQKLVLWQAAAGMAAVAAISLGVVLSQPPVTQPPIVVVMAAQSAAVEAGVQPVAFVAGVSPDGAHLVLKPLDDTQQRYLNRALELWAVPPSGAPRSLGLLAADGTAKIQREHLLDNTAAFAVSVEPPGGSPTGAPTGPIISVGAL